MNYAYTDSALVLMDSTAKAVRRCITIGNAHHGSSYWWNKQVRFFQNEPSAYSVNIPCVVNLNGGMDGNIRFDRDGSLHISINH